MENNLESSPSSPDFSEDSWIYQLGKFGDLLSCRKRCIQKCTQFQALILIITSQIWYGWKYKNFNVLKTEHIFLQNQKINLCLRWQIFGSYRFLVEVTFKVKVKNADFIQCNIFLVYLNETSSLQIDRHGSWVRSKYSRNLKFKYSNYSIMSCPLITRNLKKLLL